MCDTLLTMMYAAQMNFPFISIVCTVTAVSKAAVHLNKIPQNNQLIMIKNRKNLILHIECPSSSLQYVINSAEQQRLSQ